MNELRETHHEVSEQTEASGGPVSDRVTVVLELPKEALVHRAAPPDLVTQHNCFQVLGIWPRQFLELIRVAPLEVAKLGRSRAVRREALLAYVESLIGPKEPRSGPEQPPSLAEQLGLEENDG